MADVAIPSSGGGPIVVGMYTGSNTAERTIQLGFTPSAVVVTYDGGGFADGPILGGIVTKGHPVTYGSNSGFKILEIVENGFMVFQDKSHNIQTNGGWEHYYIAFR